MKTMLYGNIFYKHICNYHFIEEANLLLDIKKNLKEKIGGES